MNTTAPTCPACGARLTVLIRARGYRILALLTLAAGAGVAAGVVLGTVRR